MTTPSNRIPVRPKRKATTKQKVLAGLAAASACLATGATATLAVQRVDPVTTSADTSAVVTGGSTSSYGDSSTSASSSDDDSGSSDESSNYSYESDEDDDDSSYSWGSSSSSGTGTSSVPRSTTASPSYSQPNTQSAAS